MYRTSTLRFIQCSWRVTTEIKTVSQEIFSNVWINLKTECLLLFGSSWPYRAQMTSKYKCSSRALVQYQVDYNTSLGMRCIKNSKVLIFYNLLVDIFCPDLKSICYHLVFSQQRRKLPLSKGEGFILSLKMFVLFHRTSLYFQAPMMCCWYFWSTPRVIKSNWMKITNVFNPEIPTYTKRFTTLLNTSEHSIYQLFWTASRNNKVQLLSQQSRLWKRKGQNPWKDVLALCSTTGDCFFDNKPCSHCSKNPIQEKVFRPESNNPFWSKYGQTGCRKIEWLCINGAVRLFLNSSIWSNWFNVLTTFQYK